MRCNLLGQQQFQISNFIDNEKVGEDGNYDLDELSQD